MQHHTEIARISASGSGIGRPVTVGIGATLACMDRGFFFPGGFQAKSRTAETADFGHAPQRLQAAIPRAAARGAGAAVARQA